MPSLRQLPWESWSEWLSLRSDLLSDDPSRISDAVALVSLWHLRGRVPHAVDATAALQSTLSATWPPGDTTPRRLALALALTRMVDGLAEGGQHGARALSVSTIANRIGLPRDLVDLRHTSVHGRLPSLAQLLTAATTAVTWLRERYWDVQAQALEKRRARAQDVVTSVRKRCTVPIDALRCLSPRDAAELLAAPLAGVAAGGAAGATAEVLAADTTGTLATDVCRSLAAAGRWDVVAVLVDKLNVSPDLLRRYRPKNAGGNMQKYIDLVFKNIEPAPVSRTVGVFRVFPANDAPQTQLAPLGGRPAVSLPQ